MSSDSVNLRFWVWIHDDLVKLCLKPGERVTHSRFVEMPDHTLTQTVTWTHIRGKEAVKQVWEEVTTGKDAAIRDGVSVCQHDELYSNQLESEIAALREYADVQGLPMWVNL